MNEVALSNILMSLPPPTDNQDFFDRVVKWITRPGGTRCVQEGTDNCLYLNRITNNKCAIGGVLPKSILDVVAEDSNAVSELMTCNTYVRDYLTNVNYDLAEALQGVHDNSENWGPNGFVGWALIGAIADSYGIDWVQPREYYFT